VRFWEKDVCSVADSSQDVIRNTNFSGGKSLICSSKPAISSQPRISVCIRHDSRRFEIGFFNFLLVGFEKNNILKLSSDDYSLGEKDKVGKYWSKSLIEGTASLIY